MENGAPLFKNEGLTIEQLRDLVLGGPNNFEIMRNNNIEYPKLDGMCITYPSGALTPPN